MLDIVVFSLLKLSKTAYQAEGKNERSQTSESYQTQFLLWLGFGTGSATGLMVIGHAAGIVVDMTDSDRLSVVTVMLIAIGNMTGGLIIGWLADRMQLRQILLYLSAASALVTSFILFNNQPNLLIIGLTLIGFFYGAIIAVYPTVVASIFGAARSARIYGKVFTVWGAAGLLGPWFAGYLYDISGNYRITLMVAVFVSFISFGTVFFIKFSSIQARYRLSF